MTVVTKLYRQYDISHNIHLQWDQE